MAEIRSLTALRGIAASWIVLHHFWPQTSSATPYVIAKGYLAVDLFFVLSGAVLFLVYSGDLKTGQFSLRRFAWKRMARLYPVHIVTLFAAVLVLKMGPMLEFEARPVPYDMPQMIALHASLLHSWGLTETGGLNYPSWSLSAEAFAYLLLPFLAWGVLHAGPRICVPVSIVILALAAMLFQVYWPQHLRPANGELVFTRLENDFGALRILPEFTLGLAVACTAEKGIRGPHWIWIGPLAIAGGLIAGQDLIVVLGFAALIGGLLMHDPKTPTNLHRLGEVSYSLYMCHALIQIAGFKIIETFWGHPDGAVPPLFMVPMVGLTLICAVGLYRWVERPAREALLGKSVRRFHRPATERSSSI